MDIYAKPKMPLGKKLKLILLAPLATGLILSTIFVVAIVFISESSWLVNTKTYVLDKEEEYMYTLSTALGSQVESILSNALYYIYFTSELYKGVKDGTIVPSASLTNPKVINAYSVSSTAEFPDLSRSVWVSGKSSDITSELDWIKVPDALMRLIYPSLDLTRQIGLVLSDGEFEYLYPLEDTTYVNEKYDYNETCPDRTSNVFSPVCTEGYFLLENTTYNEYLNIYYENNQLNLLYRSEFGAGLAKWSEGFIREKLALNKDYTVFGSQYLGDWTLFVSNLSITSGTAKSLNELLYSDTNSRKDFIAEIMPLVIEKNGTARTGINGEKTYFSISNPEISFRSSNESMYIVGVSRKESNILSSWDTFIGEILIVSIIQACIFGIFFIITILTVWKLALVIAYRVTTPLDSITNYLKLEQPLHSINNTFNSQINSILKSLRLIQQLEYFINPVFLLNPVFEVRVKNLKFATDLFNEIDNKRGASIGFNLLGNAEFAKQCYQEAHEYYEKSLKCLEELLLEIEVQENAENELSDIERGKLDPKHDEYKTTWIDEKNFLKTSICECLQQIAMAMFMKLKEDMDPIVKMRPKWKELIKVQTQILHYYESSRKDFKMYLKLLIDMAEVYQILQYFHTATELLEIVGEELWKIDMEKKGEMDIDVSRLRRIGINIMETDKKASFEISNITFEKDILMQKMLYRKGMIELDNNRYLQACADFTLAIERGMYYDPQVREECVKELHQIVCKFGIINLTPDLKELYNRHFDEKKTIVFALCYDVKTQGKLNIELVRFISDCLNKGDTKIGAVCRNSKSKSMDTCVRDLPGLDLENFILQCKSYDDCESLIDVMHRGIDMIPPLQNTYLAVISMKEREDVDIGTLSSMQCVIPKDLKIVFLNLGKFCGLDMEIFIEDNDGDLIDAKNREFLTYKPRFAESLGVRLG